MAINKRAKNIIINEKNAHTTICGKLEIVAESISITSTKEDLVLSSNKKIIAEGKDKGGVKFGEYIPLLPNIVNMKWMDEAQKNEISDVEINQKVFLYVETEEKREGIDVSISVMTSDDSEVVLNGITEDDGIAKIEWIYI